MIEQIAKAICAVNNGGAFEFDATGKDIMDEGYHAEWEHYIEDARAALIEMLVPTNKMVATGCAVSLVPWNECSAMYTAMIRKAVEK